MTLLRRTFIPAAILLGAQAAQAKSGEYSGDFWDHVGMITNTWWIATTIATVLLGILIGFFVYRGAVSNGRAGTATGTGCLMAVLTFLLCQAIVIVILATFVFNLPSKSDVSTKDSPKQTTGTKPDNTDETGTTTPAKTPTKPPKTNGDDF